MGPSLRAAACHVSPIFLSSHNTTQKCISLIQEASHNCADLIVFPESYIPAFPIWSAILAPAQNHDLFSRMVEESIYADGEEVRAIRHAAKQTGTVVSVGISEKVRYSSATLFNTNLIIGSDGEILVHHRKLMPTFFEKLTWSPGDGHGLRVVEAAHGKIGMLICGENTNPLARYALMAQGEQVHISTWPAIWPTRMAKRPENSTSAVATGLGVEETSFRAQYSVPNSSGATVTQGSNYDNISANKIRAAAHCFEAKCFGILCSGYLDRSAIDALVSASENASSISNTVESSTRAASLFLDPTGALLPGFIIDPASGVKQSKDMLQMDEGILYADLDLADCVEGKQYHDVVGGYQRLDVFDLRVDNRRREPITFVGGDGKSTQGQLFR